ncbi:aspartate racemase [Diplonema papillatum]|nr:aspartate racemase [Diplonema papillatum]|eukprot:gene9004-13938_t
MDAAVVGVLTGVSYVSGIDYYKGLNEEYGRLVGSGTGLMPKNPLMLMVSVDCDEYAQLLVNGEWKATAEYLARGVDRLVKAGVDVVGLASNTAHISFPLLQSLYPKVPILHIADCTAKAVLEKGLKRVGLLGTEPTMRESYLKDRLALHGIETLVPSKDEDLAQIFQYIMKELGANVFKPDTRTFFVRQAALLQERGAEGLILGCTEIELLIRQEHVPTLPVFPSAAIHIKSLAKVAARQAAVDDFLPDRKE